MTEEPEDLSKYFEWTPDLTPTPEKLGFLFAAFKRLGKKPEDLDSEVSEEYRQYLEQHVDDE